MKYDDELERRKSRGSRPRQQQSSRKVQPDSRQKKPTGRKEDERARPRPPQQKARVNKKRAEQIRRRKRKQKILIIELVILILLLVGAYFFIGKLGGEKNENWTVAVFGVDSRDGSLGKGALADVTLICNVNKKTGAVQVVSVYRDTYLKINQDGTYDKINQAYHKGGYEQAVQALNENLDLKIDDYATFNWKAVADTINILGGIDLEITESEFKYINSFITETVESTGVGSHHLKSAGMNHLDGVQAVAYARLRLMDTDFKRTERQRKVISLTLEKAKQADFSVVNNILVTVLPQVKTSIGITDVLPLAKTLSDFHILESAGFPFSKSTARIRKKDCVIPTTLESNVIKLHEVLYGDLEYQPSETVKKISRKISEDSGLYDAEEVNIPSETTKSFSVPPVTTQVETKPLPESTYSLEETVNNLDEETTESSKEEEIVQEKATIEESDGIFDIIESTTKEVTDQIETAPSREIGPGVSLP